MRRFRRWMRLDVPPVRLPDEQVSSFSRSVAPLCPALDSAALPPYKNALTLTKNRFVALRFQKLLRNAGVAVSTRRMGF